MYGHQIKKKTKTSQSHYSEYLKIMTYLKIRTYNVKIISK